METTTTPAPEKAAEREFYVISVKHTQRSCRYITVWGPDNRGYRQRLQKAGRYAESTIRAHLDHYYNTGHSSIAVPCDVVDGLASDGDPRDFVGADPGPAVPRVLLNIRAVWHALLLNVIEPPPYKAEPQFPGARRRKGA